MTTMHTRAETPPWWRRPRVPVAGVAVALVVAFSVAWRHQPLAVPIVGYVAWRVACHVWRRWRFRRVYLAPTLAAITPTLGVADVRLYVSPDLGELVPRLARKLTPAEAAVRRWYGRWAEPVVRWLPDHAQRARWEFARWLEPVAAKLRRPDKPDARRIELNVRTPYLTDEQRRFVSSVIRSKIPVSGLAEQWDQVGAQVDATWTLRQRPPRRVGVDEVTAALPKLAADEFYLGATASGRPVTVSLADDSPHIACSAGSGAGKSVLAQLVAVQVLARGGRVVILDRKGSHRWARNLANVDYCTRPSQMHDALVDLSALADTRNQQALYEEDGWDPGQRVLVIAEELNGTLHQLRDHWEQTREKGEPKASPAIRALGELLFMGRSAKINVFAVAQLLSARAIGGPEARENFGIRCLARFTSNAWKMLVPQVPMPRASRTLGRWQVVVGGEATETQVAYLTAAQARELAGVPASQKVPDGPLSSNVTGDGTETGDMVDPLEEPITLREAIDEGLIPWTREATKKRLQRARDDGRPIPQPAGKRGRQADLYKRGDLILWVETEKKPRPA